MILVIDNYDSFVYNLVQYLGELGVPLRVARNDRITVEQVAEFAPQAILISPGPGRPADAGVSIPIIRELGATVPILGVCLGHQAIGEAFGGRIVRAPETMHGKTSWIHHEERSIFAGLPRPFEATRYHSLIIDRPSCPAELEITAWTEEGLIMAVQHRARPLTGVQFHPESILTSCGRMLLANFLRQHQISIREPTAAGV